ncbi:MAG: prolyl-tRNA synthetase associated domain-containing protein [Anaerotignaceae bacterium]
MNVSEKEQRIYDVLHQLNIEYKLYRHEAIYTVDGAAELDKKIGVEICKNLFLTTNKGKDYYLLTMAGNKKFNTGKVSKQLGVSRMTFAPPAPMEELLNITPGSVSPLGLINDKHRKVTFLIDKDVLEMDKISVHPCVNTATVLLNTKDLMRKILPHCNHSYIEVEV